MKKEVDENNVVSYKQDNCGTTAEVYTPLKSWKEIIIGKSGTEAVQILLNRNWLVLFSILFSFRDHQLIQEQLWYAHLLSL